MSIHIFHECADCDILENTRNIIASIQFIPKVTLSVVSKMRELIPISNSTSEKFECFKDDDEKETSANCQSCSLDTNTTSAIRSCKQDSNSVHVRLYEHTTLDNQRRLGNIYVECVQSRCNTRNTAQETLRIFTDARLAQHYYNLSSSSTVLSYSAATILVFMFAVRNIFNSELD